MIRIGFKTKEVGVISQVVCYQVEAPDCAVDCPGSGGHLFIPQRLFVCAKHRLLKVLRDPTTSSIVKLWKVRKNMSTSTEDDNQRELEQI